MASTSTTSAPTPADLVEPGDTRWAGRVAGLSVSGALPGDQPCAVVRPRSADAVAAAVRWATARGRQVAVRSGGHGLSFAGLRDGAVALDLRHLDEVAVADDGMTASFGPGATALGVAAALGERGRAFPTGHAGDVGLGGFLLAGGNGWNQGWWGSAAESVEAVEVVWADGARARLDRDHDPEAFAVVRGAGSGFPGVVTRFHVRTWPAPVVRSCSVSFHGDDVEVVAALADALQERISPRVELTLYLRPANSPRGLHVDHPTVFVSATAHGDDDDRADALLADPLAVLAPSRDGTPSWAPPGTDAARRRAAGLVDRRTDLVGMLREPPLGDGTALRSQQAWVRCGYATVLPALLPAVVDCPSAAAGILVTASSHRRVAPPSDEPLHRPLGTMTVAPYALWDAGTDDERNSTWPTAALDLVSDHWTGHYVAELDLRLTPERLPECWVGDGLRRVEALRDRVDPGGAFCGYLGH